MKLLSLVAALTGVLVSSTATLAAPISDQILLSLPSKTIHGVSNHPYSTVVSPKSSLAVVSGFQGATLVNYKDGTIVKHLDFPGAASSSVFVEKDGVEIIYVLAFTNEEGYDVTNGIYAFPLTNGQPGKRLEYTQGSGMKGNPFPHNSFSISATADGKYVYFVTVEDTVTNDQYSKGKRWLNRIDVDTDKITVTPIAMPDWSGWPGDGGDSGVAVSPDGSVAILPHDTSLYRVTNPASSDPNIKTIKSENAGDAALINSSGSTMYTINYGDVSQYQLSDLSNKVIYKQSDSSESMIQSGQLFNNDQNLLITLQDVSASTKRMRKGVNGLFLPNKVLSIDLKTGKQKTLYNHIWLTHSYPTSAAVTKDNQYLLVSVWNMKSDTTQLEIYDHPNVQTLRASPNVLK